MLAHPAARELGHDFTLEDLPATEEIGLLCDRVAADLHEVRRLLD